MPLPFERGEIVLTRFPYSDFSGSSVRPALIVSPGPIGQDLILVGISSVIRGSASATDCPIEQTHPEFAQTGLRVASVVRPHKLAIVEQSIVVRRLGRSGPQCASDVDREHLRYRFNIDENYSWTDSNLNVWPSRF